MVDKEESYGFHWDYPLINCVNDFENGIFYVYVARNPLEGVGDHFGWYIDTKDSIKIDEEAFEPVFHPCTGYQARENDYPAVYFFFILFREAGGRTGEDIRRTQKIITGQEWQIGSTRQKMMIRMKC